MSITSNIHTAVVYEAKGANQTKAQFGQRLVVTIAKADKAGNYGPHLQQTMATSIPLLTVNDIRFDDTRVQLACIDYFKSVQNKIVNDNIKETGKKEITTEQLSQAAILEYLADTESATGEKWTAEKIASWFTESLAENIAVALLSKGLAEDKLEETLNAWQIRISDTLSSKKVIPVKLAENIKKALDLGDQSDAVIIKFQTRINSVIKPVSLEDSLGL